MIASNTSPAEVRKAVRHSLPDPIKIMLNSCTEGQMAKTDIIPEEEK